MEALTTRPNYDSLRDWFKEAGSVGVAFSGDPGGGDDVAIIDQSAHLVHIVRHDDASHSHGVIGFAHQSAYRGDGNRIESCHRLVV